MRSTTAWESASSCSTGVSTGCGTGHVTRSSLMRSPYANVPCFSGPELGADRRDDLATEQLERGRRREVGERQEEELDAKAGMGDELVDDLIGRAHDETAPISEPLERELLHV